MSEHEQTSALHLLMSASRPYVPFTVDYEGTEVHLLSRRPSASQALELNKIFTKEYQRNQEDWPENEADLAILLRSLEKQKADKLAKFIVDADRTDFLQEASSELDDKPLDDSKVIKRAEAMMEEAVGLLKEKSQEYLLQEALERRKYILASIRAVAEQTKYMVLYTVYNPDKSPFAASIEEINDLPPGIVDTIMRAGAAAQVENDSPLKSPPKKSARGRTSSQSTSAAESTAS